MLLFLVQPVNIIYKSIIAFFFLGQINYSTIVTQRLQWDSVLRIIVCSESSKVELPSEYSWMTQKLLQHCWSHFLRDLSRCLHFHSYLCHHAGCLPTVAFPSEFQGLQKKERGEEKTNKGRSACRWRIGIQCQHLWKSFQILQHKKKLQKLPQKCPLQATGCISGLCSCWASPTTRSWTTCASWFQQYNIMTFPIIFNVTAVLCSWYLVIFQVQSLVPGAFERKTEVPQRLGSLTFFKVLIPPQPRHSSSPKHPCPHS